MRDGWDDENDVLCVLVVFFQAEDGIRDDLVTGVQTCALPIYFRIAAPAQKSVLKVL